jgi:hypothetical protein
VPARKNPAVHASKCGGKRRPDNGIEPAEDRPECEARRVAFGKAVFAETFDLLEAAFREFAFVTIGKHAVDHLRWKVPMVPTRLKVAMARRSR